MAQEKGPTTLLLLAVALLARTSVATGAETVWTEPITKSIAISTTNLKELHVKTHNGSITFTGDADRPQLATVTLKGGGKSAKEAKKALEAIELLAPSPESGEAHLGWRWKDGGNHRDWQASVSFAIVASPALDFSAQTHNGPIKVARVDGDVEAGTHNGKIGVSDATGDVAAETHNGRMKIHATGKKLECRSHNGRIDVQFTGTSIELATHNGVVVANVSGGAQIGGRLSTHNGSVTLLVGEKTATNLKCRTNRGEMHCDAPLSAMELTKGALTGKLGGGGNASLAINTNNGAIEVLVGE